MDPFGLTFALLVVAIVYSALLSISELPKKSPTTCDKHPGAAQCVCRGNLPRPKR